MCLTSEIIGDDQLLVEVPPTRHGENYCELILIILYEQVCLIFKLWLATINMYLLL